MRNSIRVALVATLAGAGSLWAQGLPSPVDKAPQTEAQSEREDREAVRPYTHRDVQVQLQSRDEGGVDVSRFLVESNWSWEMSGRSFLQLRVPYQKISTSQTGQRDADLNGFQDMQLTFLSGTPDDERSTVGRYEVFFNLPAGKNGLSSNEDTALTRTNAAADSFFAIQTGVGLGAGVGYLVTTREGNRQDDFALRLRVFGDYQANNYSGSVSRNGGRDYLDLSWTRSYRKEKSNMDFGLRAMLFANSYSILNGTRSEIESSTNVHAWFNHQLLLNDRHSVDYRIYYQKRGSVDGFNLGQTPVNTDLGDRIIWSIDLHRLVTDNGRWSLGLNGIWRDATEIRGVRQAGTRRDENYGHLGYTRSNEAGRGWAVDAHIGLSRDALDHRIVGRWFLTL